jgi:hypothetical protein
MEENGDIWGMNVPLSSYVPCSKGKGIMGAHMQGPQFERASMGWRETGRKCQRGAEKQAVCLEGV